MGKDRMTGKEEANDAIISHIREIIDITPEEQFYFLSLLKYRKVRRRQYILQAGDVCRYETYIIKGCMRSYFIDEDGIEHVIMFAVENCWITDGLSFTNGTPAGVNIDAMEECEVFQIDKPALEELYLKVSSFERFFPYQIPECFYCGTTKGYLQFY